MSASLTEVAASEARPPSNVPLRRTDSRWTDRAFQLMLLSCLAVALVFLVVLLVSVVTKGWPRLDSNLLQNMPSRRPKTAGVQSAILGSLWVVGITALLCIPIGVMAAIYLEEYADGSRWYNRLIEVNIQNLAAVPAIIYGILGLGLIYRGIGLGPTVITASLTLTLLVLPVIIIASREAIRAVPNSIRFGSLALGATKWQTVRKQVLPAAIPGMAAGAILGLSRALGEAAPLILLGGVSFVTFNPDGLMSNYTVLPIQIFGWTLRPQEDFRIVASAAIVVLLAVLLLMNSIAIILRNRFQKRW